MKKTPSDKEFYRLLDKRLSVIASERLRAFRASTEQIVQKSTARGMREDSLRQFSAFFEEAIPEATTFLFGEVEKHFELNPQVPFDASTIKELAEERAARWLAFAERQYCTVLSSIGMPELHNRIRDENVAPLASRVQQRLETGLSIAEATVNAGRSRGRGPLDARGKTKRGAFRAPAGTKWEDVRMLLLNEHTFEVSVKKTKRRFDFSEMGFRDGRKKDPIPRKSWELLIRFAEDGRFGWSRGSRASRLRDDEETGQILYVPGAQEEKVKKRIGDVANTLKSFFAMTDQPFHPYIPGRGWVPRFKIERDQ